MWGQHQAGGSHSKVYVGVHLFARAGVKKYRKLGWSPTRETYSPQFWWPKALDQSDRVLVSSEGSGQESVPPRPAVWLLSTFHIAWFLDVSP